MALVVYWSWLGHALAKHLDIAIRVFEIKKGYIGTAVDVGNNFGSLRLEQGMSRINITRSKHACRVHGKGAVGFDMLGEVGFQEQIRAIVQANHIDAVAIIIARVLRDPQELAIELSGTA